MSGVTPAAWQRRYVFWRASPLWMKAALKTDIGQQVARDTQQILKDYLNS